MITKIFSNHFFMINHLAIIMDGNRRWAKSRLLPSVAGHKAWADNARKIVELADNKGIKYITLWALSTENLQKRWNEEVEAIIKLVNNIESFLSEMITEWLKFQVIWDVSRLPDESQKILAWVIEKTKNNTWIVTTLALIYGGQDEIVRGMKKFIVENKDKANFEEIYSQMKPEDFRKYLDVCILPKPDVIVRTGWDIRHSWFLLFDSDYSEYYFTEKWWPAFDEDELDKVIDFFDNSKRNFGK